MLHEILGLEMMTTVFNAAAGKKCGVKDCPFTPTSSTNDLCRKHEQEMVVAAEKWELGKLKRKYPNDATTD